MRYLIFLQSNVTHEHFALIKRATFALDASFVWCLNGFVTAWHERAREENSQIAFFYVSEAHIESADVIYAAHSASIPTLSFAVEESPLTLLVSRSSHLITDEELTASFFSSSTKGCLIVVDGADGAGKETQTDCLKNRLQKMNLDVTNVAFPDYGKFCGSTIRDVLLQRRSSVKHLCTLSLSLMFTLNRLSKRDELLWLQKKGICVLLDRYYTANFGYQGSKVSDRSRENFLEYLEFAEVEWLKLPRPDMVVYLDVPPQVALAAMKNDSTRLELDVNETASVDVKEKIREVFCGCCKTKDNWTLILSCDERGERYSIEVVHQMIWSAVSCVLEIL